MDQKGLLNIVETLGKIAVALAKELLSILWKQLLKWVDTPHFKCRCFYYLCRIQAFGKKSS